MKTTNFLALAGFATKTALGYVGDSTDLLAVQQIQDLEGHGAMTVAGVYYVGQGFCIGDHPVSWNNWFGWPDYEGVRFKVPLTDDVGHFYTACQHAAASAVVHHGENVLGFDTKMDYSWGLMDYYRAGDYGEFIVRTRPGQASPDLGWVTNVIQVLKEQIPEKAHEIQASSVEKVNEYCHDGDGDPIRRAAYYEYAFQHCFTVKHDEVVSGRQEKRSSMLSHFENSGPVMPRIHAATRTGIIFVASCLATVLLLARCGQWRCAHRRGPAVDVELLEEVE